MNLYVGNLNPSTSEADLKQLFSEFGSVISSKVLIDPATGMPRGFGFVEMEQKGDAFDAIDNLDQTYFMGNIITVKEGRTKQQGGGRNFNRGKRDFQRGGNRSNFQERRNYNNNNSDSNLSWNS